MRGKHRLPGTVLHSLLCGLPGSCFLFIMPRGGFIHVFIGPSWSALHLSGYQWRLHPHFILKPCRNLRAGLGVVICRNALLATRLHSSSLRMRRQLLHRLAAFTLLTARCSPGSSPGPHFSSPLQPYHHPNRLLRCLLGARQYKFSFMPVAGPDDSAALDPTD